MFEKKQVLFLFAGNGETCSFSNDNLVLKNADGTIKHQSSCYRIFVLFIIGNISLTTYFIKQAKCFGFSIVLMSEYLRIMHVFGFEGEGNLLLRQNQYGLDDSKKLEIARSIVANKIDNQRTNLVRQRQKSERTQMAIDGLKTCSSKVISATAFPSLMGIEGNAAKLYFPQHFDNCSWKGRKPRIKGDYVNATLDIGYTILFSYAEAFLRVFGFDLYLGNLHQSFYMRKSLVCDMVEPFRATIDASTKKAIARGRCQKEHFEVINSRFLLKNEHKKEYANWIMRSLLKEKEAMYSYFYSFYRYMTSLSKNYEFPYYEMRP